MPGFSFMGESHWRLVSLVLMALIAFGIEPEMPRQGCAFLLLSLALGGVGELLGRGDAVTMMASVGILFGLCFVGSYGEKEMRSFVMVQIRHGDKEVEMTALVDTGNCLKDPITGHRVLVVDPGVARTLLGLECATLRDPAGVISRGTIRGLRLVPYCSVGCPAGLMLAICPDQLRIDGKCSQQLVAFAPYPIGVGKMYQALSGGII